jgi:TPR repeat protein
VPQDYAEAYFWLDLAAAGDVTGLNSEDTAKARDAATSHLTSAVLLQTQERARKWFENHAADMQRTPAAVAPISAPAAVSASEDAETQFHRGTLYETGNGVQQDYAQAVLWYRKAAEQNLAIAQYRLGVLYANGVGVPLDKSQAAAWFQKAADQGYVYAQVMLGSDYLTGDGVQRDYAEAYFWFDIACASNAREVVAGQRATMRDTAAAYLSPADLSRVQERARKWLEDHPAKPQ